MGSEEVLFKTGRRNCRAAAESRPQYWTSAFNNRPEWTEYFHSSVILSSALIVIPSQKMYYGTISIRSLLHLSQSHYPLFFFLFFFPFKNMFLSLRVGTYNIEEITKEIKKLLF